MKIVISPERATQVEAPASNPMTDMRGTRAGFALSGLVPLGVTFTQGAALGWSVVAPSGRQKRSWDDPLIQRQPICGHLPRERENRLRRVTYGSRTIHRS